MKVCNCSGMSQGPQFHLTRGVRAAGRAQRDPWRPLWGDRGHATRVSLFIYFLTVANSHVPFCVHCNQLITKEAFALCNDAVSSNKWATFSNGGWCSSFRQARRRGGRLQAPRGRQQVGKETAPGESGAVLGTVSCENVRQEKQEEDSSTWALSSQAAWMLSRDRGAGSGQVEWGLGSLWRLPLSLDVSCCG